MIRKISTIVAVMALCVGLFVTSTNKASAQVYSQNSGQTIVRDLTVGSAGSDVVNLQVFLITNGFLGFNPGYFDQQTKSAVIKFQSAYGIPATGYFGPISRSVYNKLVVTTVYNPVPTPTNCPSGFISTVHQGFSTCVLPISGTISHTGNDRDNDDLRGDEADLRNFEVNEGDDSDLEEGDDSAEIVEVEFDVEDGDIRITRADFNFLFTGDSSEEDQPWEIFDRAYLLSDGDEVAEIDASDKDEWDRENNDEYMLRFANFREVIREDDTAHFTLEVDVQNDIDGDDISWEIYVPDNGIRGIDVENNSQEIGDEDQTVEITIGNDNNNDNEDDDDNNDFGLTVSESNDNPDSMDIDVYEDEESDWETIFAFEITAEDEEITLSDLPISLEFFNNGTFNDVIEEIEITIDGDTFDDVDVEDADEDMTVLTFRLDDEVTIEEDETVTVEVRVIFREADGNYDDGEEIQAFIDSENVDNIEAENEDGDTLNEDDLHGSAQGEVHTLEVND